MLLLLVDVAALSPPYLLRQSLAQVQLSPVRMCNVVFLINVLQRSISHHRASSETGFANGFANPLIFEDIHLGLGELPCADAALEQEI